MICYRVGVRNVHVLRELVRNMFPENLFAKNLNLNLLSYWYT